MRSPTQRVLTIGDIADAVRVSFGPAAAVRDAAPMTGGSFGAVWRVDLADGRRTVLKAGPEPGARLLTYEAGMLGAEADYLRLLAARAPDVPAPRLLHETGGWLFMTLLPGVALPSLPPEMDRSVARFESGAAVARLHAVTGDRFGYPGDRPHATDWPTAFTGIVDAILDDADAWRVPLPVPAAEIRATVAAHAGLLGSVGVPSLLHFDLWDGNVLAAPDASGVARLTGLVDGERHLWGDPLLDFASPALFRDIFDDPDDTFTRGYGSVRPLVVDAAARRRAWLYQLYLYLVMVVEFPSRGMTPAAEPRRWALLGGLVRTLVAKLTRGDALG